MHANDHVLQCTGTCFLFSLFVLVSLTDILFFNHALGTFTRLDAFYALQDLWQFKHLLTIVPLIRIFSRYAFLWYLIGEL